MWDEISAALPVSVGTLLNTSDAQPQKLAS